MRVVNTQLRTSAKIASATARLGGKTVRVTGKTIKRSMKIPAVTVKKVKLMKLKLRHLNKTVVKNKLKKAVAASGKFVVKSAKFTVKSGVKAAGKAADGLTDSIDNDAVKFAKQSFDAARAAAETAKKAGKAAASGAKFTGRTIKTSAKVVRTLATKKGRMALNKSIHRGVERINRKIRRIKATPKRVKKAVKKIIQLGVRFIGFLLSTLPWSAFLLVFAAVVLLFSYLVSSSYFIVTENNEKVAGWAMKPGDTESQLYSNIAEVAVKMETACENSFARELKQEITSFCSQSAEPPSIVEYKVGSSSGVIYPAADATVNSAIDGLVGDVTAYSSKYFSEFIASLVVLMSRGKDETFALEQFTEADMQAFLGGVNNNSCDFGSTYFVKTTSITDGETCPNEDCKKKTKPGCDCGGKDENGRKKCAGHPYCNHDHKKMTVKLQTISEETGKSMPQIYGFNDTESEHFTAISGFISDILKEMSGIGGASH